MTNKMERIVLASRPSGNVELNNFRIENTDLPVPGFDQFLARTIWLSLDPYMRG